jgi:hypothetical protein
MNVNPKTVWSNVENPLRQLHFQKVCLFVVSVNRNMFLNLLYETIYHFIPGSFNLNIREGDGWKIGQGTRAMTRWIGTIGNERWQNEENSRRMGSIF